MPKPKTHRVVLSDDERRRLVDFTTSGIASPIRSMLRPSLGMSAVNRTLGALLSQVRRRELW